MLQGKAFKQRRIPYNAIICRVEQYISKGWDKNVENPEAARQQLLPPDGSDGWKTLGSSDDTTMLSFNNWSHDCIP